MSREQNSIEWLNDTVQLACELIRIPSVSGAEAPIVEYLVDYLREVPLTVTRMEVAEGRSNILFSKGTPEILFTTHMDVVPCEMRQLDPQVKDGRLYGRGACDAKGIIAAMISAAKRLLNEGGCDFGLLFVVGEEEDAIGANAASSALKQRGVRYVINGEPTEGKLVSGHKGGIGMSLTFRGRSCHSGYPSLGEDANRAMIETAHRLYQMDWGSDPLLGPATINIGLCSGGIAPNVISDSASMKICLRTVRSGAPEVDQIRGMLPDHCDVVVHYAVDPARLMTVPEFECTVVSYGSDAPIFQTLTDNVLMYGPGTIHLAHTVSESVAISELETAVQDYVRLFKILDRMRR